MTFCPLKNVCRLCGNKAKLLIGVFDPDGEAITLERKIRMCLPITVSTEDNMPKQVCHGCLQKLETSYELYLTCNSAQTTIKRLLKLQDSIGNSSSAPKTCFIEQCEREKEKNCGNGVTRDVRSLDIQVTPSPPGQSFPNRTCIIEPGPICNRVPMSNGFSMSTSVVNAAQTAGQPVSQQNAVVSNGAVALNDLSPIGQIRRAPQLQVLSMQLQPVGMIKPIQQGPQIMQVYGAVESQPSTNHLPTEPIDSKENLRLSLQAKNTPVVAPTLTSTPAVTSVATHTPTVTQMHTPNVTQTHTPTITQTQMQTVTQTQTHIPPIIHTHTNRLESAKSGIAKGVRRASLVSKARKSTETSNTNNNVVKSTTNNSVANTRASNSVMQNGTTTSVAQSAQSAECVSVCNAQAAEDSSAEAATAVAAILDVNDDDHFEPLTDDTCDSIEDIECMTVAKRPRTKSTDVEVACRYCHKMFSEDVIMLHQNLHLRVKFFSCMDCDKNFTTEQGLNKHKCESKPDS